MADPNPLPSLSDSPASDLGRYQPLSWLAVASVAVSVLFVVVLVVLGFFAMKSGKPLREGVLFVLPAAGIGLAFAARRAIRNSEGTRAGESYAATGWWVSVVAGLIFMAYWFAVDWSVRTDAEKQMARWAEELVKANPNDLNDPAVRNAFVKTIDPANQDSAQATDPKIFQAQFGQQYAVFRQTNLLLTAYRNRDSVRILPQGLRKWELIEDYTYCEAAGTLNCAEGEFPMVVKMRLVPVGTGRKWQILGSDTYLPEDSNHRPIGLRTRYGWLIERLDAIARQTATEFTYTLMNHQRRQPLISPSVQMYPPPAAGQSLALDAFVTGRIPTELTEKVLLSSLGRELVAGGPSGMWGGDVAPPNTFYAREDGAPLPPEDRKVLASCWEAESQDRILLAGQGGASAAPVNSVIEPTTTAVTIKVPVVLKPTEGEFKVNPMMFSSGKLVVVCDDPALLTALAAAKAGDKGVSQTPPPDLNDLKYRFRVVRLESNLPKHLPPSTQSVSSGP